MPAPSRVTLWGGMTSAVGGLVLATAVAVGIPVAAIRFDDPSRLAWLLIVPVAVAFAIGGLVTQPYRIVVADSGVEVKWVGRSLRLERNDLLEIVATRGTTLMGEGLALRSKTGRSLDLPNDGDRLFAVLQARFPEVPCSRSDSRYLTS